MAHLLEDPKDISVLKAYWVNHAIDQNVEYGANTNKRQTCVGVYGVDIHPDGSRFATCGADQKIKIWSMAPIINVNVEVSECVDKLLCVCKYDQTSNQNTNNQTFNNTIHCVKWSNNGVNLASGAADGIVTIWKLSNKNNNASHTNNKFNNNNNHNPNHNHNHNNKNIEHWVIAQQLTKHRDEANTLTTDVQDIVWSPDDKQLVSAGSDHNIIIWNKTNNNNNMFQCMQTIRGAHDDIILGLSFDPIGDFVLSQSADGSAKVWSVQNGYTMHQKITSQFKNANDDLTRLDVCQRGSWSPDGLHLLTSFGVTQDNIFISPMYHRDNFSNEHSFVGHCKPTTVSKWNPRIYQSADGKAEMFHVAAVGSMDRKLSIWCTNAKKPIIVLTEIGKESVLDLSWSRSGDILMASTHDGNVMVFVFGKHVFCGHKLSINQHVSYVNQCYQGLLHENIQKNIRNNITLGNEFKFNQIKARQESNKSVVSASVDDTKMDQESNCSDHEFIPSESAFGPREDVEINLDINFAKYIKFNAIEGKQRAPVNITDYYATQRETNSNSNIGRNEYVSNPVVSPLLHNNNYNASNNNNKNNKNKKIHQHENETLSIRKKKVKKKKEKRNREKDKEDNNGNEPRKKKRKYNEKLIKIDHNEKIMFEITFNNDRERGIFKISGVNKENLNNSKERVCEFKQFVVINGNERLLWQTEIPSFITQCVCNEQWTICGSSDGELYCFDNNGILVITPIQIEEEIVFLFLTKVFTQSLIENEDIYLLIITNDCTLRQWKLNKNMNGFEPTQILQTNISNLLLKNKKNKKEISLKNGFITNNGKIILTLSNGYIFTYQQSLNCWLRICDDKYPLSNQRKISINHNNNNNNNNHNNNNGNEIGKLSLKFSELLTAMNNNSKSMIGNPNNININMELSAIHTISHLEQELITLSLFKNKEIEFGNIIQKYIDELLNSLTFKKLSFMVVNKMNKIFNCLLNGTNNWSGFHSVLSQRKLLSSLIQMVNQKNNDPQKEWHAKLQQLTNKYSQALNACSSDII